MPNGFWDRWEENRVRGVLEFVRTGRSDEFERVQAKLEDEFKKRHPDRRVQSPALRWGIEPDLFNQYCVYLGAIGADEAEPRAVYNLVERILHQLMKRALQGHRTSIGVIAKIAHEATSNVERLTREQLQHIRALAEKAASFPILISTHPDMSKRAYIGRKLETLNIGAHAALNMSGFDMRSTSGQPFKGEIHMLCDRLYRTLIDIREDLMNSRVEIVWWQEARALPPLSESTSRADAKKWFDVGWKVLCAAMNNHPENLPMLQEVGRYKALYWKKDSIRTRKFANAEQAGLYERLKAAFLARYARTE